MIATVLVVEDEEHLRTTLAYNLRKAGYDIQPAASGPEALARFQATHPSDPRAGCDSHWASRACP